MIIKKTENNCQIKRDDDDDDDDDDDLFFYRFFLLNLLFLSLFSFIYLFILSSQSIDDNQLEHKGVWHKK